MLKPGDKFGEFDVLEELGRGGMGAVFRVRDPRNGCDYAAKVMLADLLDSEDLKRRFIREAEIAMQIDHPNLVRVYDVGRDPETNYAYMIMDYIPGGSLREAIQRRLIDKKGPYTVKEALTIVRKLLAALSAAHVAGVVHRDIKTDNILFDAEGEPRLADLGIAKVGNDATVTRLTMTNVVVGTPAYMSPEQMTDSHDVDGRADLYSLGVVLWEMLTCENPNADLTPSDLMRRALRLKPLRDIRSLRPKLPAYVVSFINRLTNPRPDRRFASADAALRYLNQWRHILKRRLRLFAVLYVLLLLIVGAAGVYFALHLFDEPETPATVEKAEEPSEFDIPESVD